MEANRFAGSRRPVQQRLRIVTPPVGGLTVVTRLRRADADVTVIDRAPSLLPAAIISRHRCVVADMIRRADPRIPRRQRTSVVFGEVTGVISPGVLRRAAHPL